MERSGWRVTSFGGLLDAAVREQRPESVLSHAAKAIEIEDIYARLRELEAAAEQHPNSGGRRMKSDRLGSTTARLADPKRSRRTPKGLG